MSKWEDTLQQFNESYATSEARSTWAPPPGKYDALLTDVDRTITEQDGVAQPRWSIKAQIIGGEQDGKEFSMGTYTPKNFGMLKSLIATLTGEVINDLSAADEALKAVPGMAVALTAKKNPKGYTNFYVNAIIDAGGAAPQEAAPEADA